MDKIRWGMIGCGDVTEVKSGPAFNRIEHSILAAVMARTGEKARDYAQRHGVPAWYERADALIHDPQVNAIYIATPPDAHCEYTLMAAAAGKPVYVEKPMARTHAECLRMIEACKKAGVGLYVAYYRRCLPLYLKVKELVAGGAVGDVRLVSVRLLHSFHPGDRDLPWRVRPEISGGGHFYDLGAHQLDYLDDLLGPVTASAGQAANQAGLYPAEDAVTGSWMHQSGVLGSGVWCFTTAHAQQTDHTEIIGSRGRLVFSFFETQPLRLETDQGVEEFDFKRQDPIQEPLIQTVVNALRGVGTCPSTGESAARTNAVMENLVASYNSKSQQNIRAG
jgi:predicted dehydrogenase